MYMYIYIYIHIYIYAEEYEYNLRSTCAHLDLFLAPVAKNICVAYCFLRLTHDLKII